MHQFVDKNQFKQRFGDDHFFEEYEQYAARLKPFVADTAFIMHYALTKGKKIMFEGAQGTLLDIDHGTYPFVTSSNTTAGAVCTGLGIAPKHVKNVLGVTKAYKTRVGNGPFPTELIEGEGKKLAEVGKEFGATTGRARRVGWFDAVLGKYAVMVNGTDSLALTKLDVFNGMKKLKICTSYKYHGKELNSCPTDSSTLEKVEPVYEEFDGWWDDITKMRSFEALPANAKKYISRIEQLLGVPVSLLSVGPGREQTIVIKPDFLL